MNIIAKRLFIAAFFIFGVASPLLAVASPVVQSAAAATGACSESRLLGIPPWYRGLTQSDGNGGCMIKSPTALDRNGKTDDNVSEYIWTIVLNIIEMAIVIVAYIAVFFIIYGGFLYLTGGSSPDKVEKARKSILNAVIGLIIAMSAIAVVNLIFGIITK